MQILTYCIFFVIIILAKVPRGILRPSKGGIPPKLKGGRVI